MNTSWFMDTDRTRLHGRKQVETTPEEFYGNLKWSISKTRKSQYTFESLRRDGSTNWNSSKIKKWIRSFNSRFESAIIYQIYSPPSPTFSSLSTIAIKFPSKMTVGKSRHISLERRFCHEFDRCWLWCRDQWRLKCWHQRWSDVSTRCGSDFGADGGSDVDAHGGAATQMAHTPFSSFPLLWLIVFFIFDAEVD